VSAPENPLNRRLLFVTGKGGVGKSTVSAALAEYASRIGKTVLLVEVDAKGNLADFFEHEPVGFDPVEIQPNLHLMTMNTQDSLREYMRLFLKVPLLGRLGPIANMFDWIATALPGIREILTTGKICWELRASLEGSAPWDLIVVDAAATGHIVGQLDAAQSIMELVQVGMVRQQTDWMIELLSDRNLTGLLIVTTPEEMPVSETIDLVGRVRDRLSTEIIGIIVNRVLPALFTKDEGVVFDRIAEEDRDRVAELFGDDALEVIDSAALARTMRQTRAAHMQRLADAVSLPLMYVPYLFVRSHGRRVTSQLAEALGEEL
jgi:anion-transporting  ArsA/GET3 family ATPase